MNYIILESNSTTNLQDKVNEYMEKGYIPHGSMVVDDGYGYGYGYRQLIVRGVNYHKSNGEGITKFLDYGVYTIQNLQAIIDEMKKVEDATNG